jgi:hypothetical protein
VRLLLAALAVLVLLAGCGGDEDDETELYTLDPTRACLVDRGVQVSDNRDDFVASTALGGSLRAEFASGNIVVLSFGESLEDAARVAAAYERFAPERVALENVLGRFRNVTMIWSFNPGQDELMTVSDCLAA